MVRRGSHAYSGVFVNAALYPIQEACNATVLTGCLLLFDYGNAGWTCACRPGKPGGQGRAVDGSREPGSSSMPSRMASRLPANALKTSASSSRARAIRSMSKARSLSTTSGSRSIRPRSRRRPMTRSTADRTRGNRFTASTSSRATPSLPASRRSGRSGPPSHSTSGSLILRATVP